jgi:hypothetical protein
MEVSVTLGCFPAMNGLSRKQVTLPKGGTLRKAFAAAGETISSNDPSTFAVNGATTTNLDAEVPDGAVVTRTAKHVRAG